MDVSEFFIKSLLQTNKLADTPTIPEAINNQQNDLFLRKQNVNAHLFIKNWPNINLFLESRVLFPSSFSILMYYAYSTDAMLRT